MRYDLSKPRFQIRLEYVVNLAIENFKIGVRTRVHVIMVFLSEHVELLGERVLTLVVEHEQVALLLVRRLHNRLIDILDRT